MADDSKAKHIALGMKMIELAGATAVEAERTLPISVSTDLTICINGASTRLTPIQGLGFAEQLARASFRAALVEEAFAVTGLRAADEAESRL